MSKKNYNKLVRDRIPEIIKSNGGVPITRTLGADEISLYLKEKLSEEMQEFLASGSTEELADIFEVILAILDERKISFEEFEQLRQNKNQTNGQFSKRIFLVSVEE